MAGIGSIGGIPLGGASLSLSLSSAADTEQNDSVSASGTCRIPVIATTNAADISGASYLSKSFDPSAQVGSIEGMALSPDGTKLYVGDFNSGIIYQYTLGTAKDITTAVYASKSLDVSAQIGAFSLAGFALSDDGTKLYTMSFTTGHIYQYTLSVAWDISTGTYSTKNFDLTSQVTNPYAVYYRADGAKFFVGDVSSNNLYQYSIGTPDDISTASYDSVSFNTSSQVGSADGLAFSSDGTAFYNGDFSTGIFYQYATSVLWDFSIAFYAGKSLNASAHIGASTQDILFSADMKDLYLSNVNTNVIYQYAMPSALTEANDSAVATGLETITGTGAPTEQSDSDIATGAQISYGTVTTTETNDSMAASGLEIMTGAVAATEQDDSEISTGHILTSGSTAQTEDDDSVAAAGNSDTGGISAITELDDSTVATGAEKATGTAAITERNDSDAATGYISAIGTVAVTEQSDSTVGHGRETFAGTAAVTESNDSASGVALETVRGVAAPHEAADTSAASASQAVRGTAAITERNDTAAIVGREIFHGDAAVTDDDDTMEAFGHSWFVAVGSITEQNDYVVGVGFSAIRIAHVTNLPVILDKTYLDVMMDIL